MAERKAIVIPGKTRQRLGYTAQRTTNDVNLKNAPSKMAHHKIGANHRKNRLRLDYTQSTTTTNSDNFECLPAEAEPNITVNRGKYLRLLGYSPQRATTTSGDNFENLPPIVLESICSKLPTNQIIRLYNYQRPIFDNVAKRALQKAVEKADSEPIRVYLKWTSDTFYRVLDLLDDKVIRLTIVATEVPTDIPSPIKLERIRAILQKCPRIQSLGLRDIRLREFTHDVFSMLPTLICIDHRSVALPKSLEMYPTIGTFQSEILSGECLLCKSTDFLGRTWYLRTINNRTSTDYFSSLGLMCTPCTNGGKPNFIQILDEKVQAVSKSIAQKWVLIS